MSSTKIADVEQVTVYRNADAVALPAAVAARRREGAIDWITITSSAIAERLAFSCRKPLEPDWAAKFAWQVSVH